MATRVIRSATVSLPLGGATSSSAAGVAGFTPHAARVMWATGAVFLIGTALDLLVLWVLQRQDQPQWEFVATTNTLEALPRLVLALALFYAALHFGRSVSLFAYRTLAVGAILLGLAALGLALLVVLDYFVLSQFAQNQPGAMAMLKASAFKGGALGGLHSVVLVTLGALGMRRPPSMSRPVSG